MNIFNRGCNLAIFFNKSIFLSVFFDFFGNRAKYFLMQWMFCNFAPPVISTIINIYRSGIIFTIQLDT